MNQNQLVATNPARTQSELSTFLKDAISKNALVALPRHLNADRMLRLALTAFSTTPKLRECTMQSILGSLVIASQIGLEPGVNGQGWLIPYKNTCTFVPGWKGLVGLINNSGQAIVWTGAVYEGDAWEFELGSHPKCRHVPNGEHAGNPDKLLWVYACGQLKGSEQTIVEAWPIERVIRHREKTNKVGRSHYSYQHLEMYARKVVLLQVLKYMPSSIELNNAITVSEATEAGRAVRSQDGVIIDLPEMPEGTFGASTQPASEPKTITEMAQAEAEEAGEGEPPESSTASADTKPEPEKKPEPKPAKKADPKEALLKKLTEASATRGRVLEIAKERELMHEKKWADVTDEEAAKILEHWDNVILPELRG